MKRLHTEADRARRYSQALVTASSAVRRAVTWTEGVGTARPAAPKRWQAQLLSRTAGSTLAPPGVVEA
jgi:hypothetical protein